jgi:hypothetical protein
MQLEHDETNIKTQKTVKKTNYFDVREEEAVKKYITAETREEKEEIYNKFLKEPLDKMIESIIRRYKLYRKDMEYNDVHSDTHSFLMTKVDKFRPAKNKKAYSYFGTICKNYLMGQIIKDQKEINRKISYEDISPILENNSDYSYSIDSDSVDSELVIRNFLSELDKFLKDGNLNENETKLGYALYDLFENYDSIFEGSSNNKFNKNIILLSLREMTNLSTKEIRSSMKKYKIIYVNLVDKMAK